MSPKYLLLSDRSQLNSKMEEYIPQMVTLIDNNMVTFLIAPTGFGKTLFISKLFAESNNRAFFIVRTFREINNLKLLFEGKYSNCTIGENPDSRIICVTTHQAKDRMINHLSNGTMLPFTDIIIMDVLFCESTDCNTILSLWMEAQRRGFKVPKLLLISGFPIDISFDSNVTVSTLEIGFADPSQRIKSARSFIKC